MNRNKQFKTQGWIKVYRKLMDWEWYTDSYMVHLFVHLMLRANRIDGEWRGIKIKTGQVATSIRSLHYATGISIRSIRTCLKRMVATHEIVIEATHICSIITINNFQYYNGLELQPQLRQKRIEEKATNILPQKTPNLSTQQKNAESFNNTNDSNTINKKPPNCSTQKTTNETTPNKNIKKNKEYNININTPSKDFSGDKKSDFIDLIVEKFSEKYKEHWQNEYEILSPQKERAAAAKILQIYKKNNPGSDTPKTMADLAEFFHDCLNITERWLHDNMSIPLIRTKYNQIINSINGSQKNKNNNKEKHELTATGEAVGLNVTNW